MAGSRDPRSPPPGGGDIICSLFKGLSQPGCDASTTASAAMLTTPREVTEDERM